MLKFKHEDLGLYFAMGLIGGGAGLLIGAFAASRIDQKRRMALQEEWGAPPDIYQPDPVINRVEKTINAEEIDSPELIFGKPTLAMEPFDANRVKEKPDAKRGKFHLSKAEQAELKRLTQEYKVSQIQVELVQNGAITTEELEFELLEIFDMRGDGILRFPNEEEEVLEISGGEGEGGVSHTDYAKPYRQEYKDEKPDMDELLAVNDTEPRPLSDLLVVVDNRFEIMLEPPENKHKSNMRGLLFDPEDEEVYSETRRGQFVKVDLGVMISPEVKDLLWDFLLFEEIGPIYIDDRKGNRWYRIEKEGTTEDGSLNSND